MSIQANDLCVSADEYLKSEAIGSERHEYVAGRVFAMVGATRAHNTMVGNFHRQIYDAVRQAGCYSFTSDMKVKVEALQSFYYPDLVISCEASNDLSVFLTAPCLIVEVLSPSTMDVDRREKLLAYREIATLKEYVLVFQDKVQIEVYRKDVEENWHCEVFIAAGTLCLTAVSSTILNIEIQNIYSGTDLGDNSAPRVVSG